MVHVNDAMTSKEPSLSNRSVKNDRSTRRSSAKKTFINAIDALLLEAYERHVPDKWARQAVKAVLKAA